MLLVGGGTGLAPLKSILRHVIENGLRREMTLYWGVRSERDLYAHGALEELARRARRSALRAGALRAIAAVAGAARHGCTRRCSREVEQLDRYEIYASGPPANDRGRAPRVRQRGVAIRAPVSSIPSTMRRIRPRASGRWPPPSPDPRPSRAGSRRPVHARARASSAPTRAPGTTQCARSKSRAQRRRRQLEQIARRSRRCVAVIDLDRSVPRTAPPVPPIRPRSAWRARAGTPRQSSTCAPRRASSCCRQLAAVAALDRAGCGCPPRR